MIRIVFFAPYPSIFSDIRKVFQARPDRDELEYEICQDIPGNPLENLNADIIIARGFTAMSLQKAGIPCAELTVSGYDVLAAVQKCRELSASSRIAILGPFSMVYGAEQIGRAIPEVSLRTYIMEDESRLEEALLQAMADGNTAVVGTHSCALTAEKYHIPAVTIESGLESVNNAISHAKASVLLARKEKLERDRYASILNFSFQGILAADSSGRITMANNYVYQSLKLEHSVLGTRLQDLFPEIPVETVIRNGARILWDIRKVHSLTLMVNCVPIPGSGKSRFEGCMLTFQRLGRPGRQEELVRTEINRRSYAASHRLEEFRSCAEAGRQLVADAEEFSYTDLPVMILGEDGTEKELLAHGIHNSSKRKRRPFASVNCAALSEEELERELFGVAGVAGKQAEERAGLFELVHQGTLYLENVSFVSRRLQARLLQVLRTREAVRRGGTEATLVNVRLICSDGPDIEERKRDGRFSGELYYHLNRLELRIPPLRERREDIAFLVRYYVGLEKERLGNPLTELSPEALQLLSRYRWPGNTQELSGFCSRLSILCRKEQADTADCLRILPELADCGERPGSDGNGRERAEAAELPAPGSGPERPAGPGKPEREAILEALRRNDYSRKKTAGALGMNPSTLWRKMKKYGI